MTHHDIPEDDNGDHERLITCKCKPKVTYEHGHQIVTHRYIDGKEAIDWAEKIINDTEK